MEQSQNKYYQGYSTSKQEYLIYKKAYKKAKKHTQMQHGGLFDSSTSIKNIIKRLEKREKYCLETFRNSNKEKVQDCIQKGKEWHETLAVPYERFYLSVEKGDPSASLFYRGRGKIAKLKRKAKSVHSAISFNNNINESKVIARLADPIDYCSGEGKCIAKADEAREEIAQGTPVQEAIEKQKFTEPQKKIFLYGPPKTFSSYGKKVYSLIISIFTSLKKDLHAFEKTAEQITQKIQKTKQETNQETNSFNPSVLNQILPETLPSELSESKQILSQIENEIRIDSVLSNLISIAKNKIEFVLITIQKDFRLPKTTKTSPNPEIVQERENILEVIELKLINRLLVALKAEESDNLKFVETLREINNKRAEILKKELANTFSKCSKRIQIFLRKIVAKVKEIPPNESQPDSRMDRGNNKSYEMVATTYSQKGGDWEFLNILKNIMSAVFLGIGIFCSVTLNNCFLCPFLIQIKLALGGIISFFFFYVLNPDSSIGFSDFNF